MSYDDESLAPALEELSTDNLTVTFEAERFKGSPLLDTSVTISGQSHCTWAQREELVRELQEVLEKYKI